MISPGADGDIAGHKRGYLRPRAVMSPSADGDIIVQETGPTVKHLPIPPEIRTFAVRFRIHT